MVLVWIGQVVLFFLIWRLFSWGTIKLMKSDAGMVTVVLVNLACAIILLIFVTSVHNVWWLMGLIGALMGVMTGMSVSLSSED